MFHPYFQLSVLTHTLITNNFFLSWQVILKPGCNYVFPIYFQLCERSRTLLSNLASATGDFGVTSVSTWQMSSLDSRSRDSS